MTPSIRSLTTSSLCMLLLSLVTAAAYDNLTILSDEFDDAGSLAQWMRIHETEGWNNNVLESIDVNTSRPGQLVMMPYTSSWYEEFRGELTYKTVTGDFAVTTFVESRNRAGTGRPERDYSLAGIMVRAPRTMTTPAEWTAGGQNYVFLSMGSANRASAGHEFEVKTTINSQSTLYIEPTTSTRATIQLVRIGPHIITLRRDEGGEWLIHRRFHRPDLPVTMQVGLTVYTDWETCLSVGYENNNRLVLTNGVQLLNVPTTLSGAQPDLVATFDFVRYARPQVPLELENADLSNAASVSDEQLLSFLGEVANVPGGAAESPSFHSDSQLNVDPLQLTANVMSNRTYRLQTAPLPIGLWSDTFTFVSTNTIQVIEDSPGPGNTFFRLISP